MATLQEEINARIEAEKLRKRNIASSALNVPTNNNGFFGNIFGGQAIPQTRPEVLNQMMQQRSGVPTPSDNYFYNMPYFFGMDQRSGAGPLTNFQTNDPLQDSLQSGIGSTYDIGTGGQGIYTGDGTIPERPGALDKMSGLEMMYLVQGLQGLLGQPDADIRLDTSSPGASSGLRLPIQDLYSGLLK